MFPILYHEHHNLYNDDLPFWFEMASQHPGPLLELGCGTGRVMLPFLETGFDMIGLDLDRSMLAYFLFLARKKTLPTPKIFQASCTDFRINTSFNLIIMPCNTFSTLSTNDQKETLINIQKHLAPGGVFVFSIPNPAYIRRLPKTSEPEVEEVFFHPTDGEPVQVSSSWQRTQSEFLLRWDYDHMRSNGTVQRSTVEIRHHLNSDDYYLNQLQEQGLRVLQSYGDYDLSPYLSSSPNLIIKAGQT